MKNIKYFLLLSFLFNVNLLFTQEKENINVDQTKHYTTSKIYNANGDLVSISRDYYNNFGKHLQSQSKSFSHNKTIVAATLYDAFGRIAINSLPAAISNEGMDYVTDFIQDANQKKYNYNDFDENGKLNEPEPVSSEAFNSLGWYYSVNNTSQPNVPETSYPYTRIEYSDITGTPRRNSLAGEYHKMGSGHETYSFTMRADWELNYFKNTFDNGIETDGILKTISVDADGNQQIVYKNKQGKVIATCKGEGGKQRTHEISLIGNGDYIDIHVPPGCAGNLSSNGASFKLINLFTEDQQQDVLPNKSGFYRIIPYGGMISTASIKYSTNYSGYSFYIYDKAGRLIKSYSPKAVANNDPSICKTYRYNSQGQVIESSSPDKGVTKFVYRKDGQIRFSENQKQRTNNTFSYTKYDDSGRPVESGEYTGTDIMFSENMDPNINLDPANCSSRTFTAYDELSNDLPLQDYEQHFVNGNVTKTWNEQSSTWYSYTYDGNVEWIIKSIGELGAAAIDYEYDFNGNVKKVIYEKNNYAERFDHVYTYDEDLRLKTVTTIEYNNDGTVKEEQLQGKYYYYPHDGVKRVEIADGLQGIDYVYNINGWLKSINHPSLDNNDPGKDGYTSVNGEEAHPSFYEDLFGMSLDYYSGDYTRQGSGITQIPGHDKYNGNIKATRWKIRNQQTENNINPSEQWVFQYQYNSEEFLKEALFGKFDISNRELSLSDNLSVKGLTYDPNGNLQNLQRYIGNQPFDNFSYNYIAGKNQLEKITDNATQGMGIDLEQGSHQFGYNQIGQMISRNTPVQSMNFNYDPYGQVNEITRSGEQMVAYKYDESGYRIKKTDYVQNTETWYVRDAGGNILSVYTAQLGEEIKQSELGIYGSSRMGVNYKEDNQYVYEISDHLGNVRVTFGEDAGGALQTYTHADYFPYGMRMPGRLFSPDEYRFGYQGQFAEHDEETGYDAFEARLWDSRIGRWMTPDPAGQFWSPYLGMGNSPMNGVDPDGMLFGKIRAKAAFLWHKLLGHDNVDLNFLSNGDWAVDWNSGDEYVISYAKNFGKEGLGDIFGSEAWKNANKAFWSPYKILWNSKFGRALTGDVIYLSLSGDLTFVGGGGYEGMLMIPLRGPQAFNGYVTDTYKLKFGVHLSGSINAGKAVYNGNINDIDIQSLTKTSYGIEGDYIYGGSAWMSPDEKNRIRWWGTSSGLGPGIGGSIYAGHTNKIRQIWNIH